MHFDKKIPLRQIAKLIGARIAGDETQEASGINEIHKVENGDLVFVDHPKYYEKCLKSDASFIIINKEVEESFGKTLLICENPFEAYLSIVKHFRPYEPQHTPISNTAVIGKNTTIMPGVFIGHHTIIGDNCIIHPNVTIYNHCVIGNNVVIHSGTVLGADAFYFNTKKNRDVWFKKMESCGRVVIADDVEIGANCCIDRGVTHDTVIGQGTKLDNLIQLGHDVVIGKNCLIASQVGIAGATTVGNGVSIWGQAGINKTLTIGDNAVVLGQAGVTATIEGNKAYMGTPAVDVNIKRREFVWIKRIPEMWDKLKKLD